MLSIYGHNLISEEPSTNFEKNNKATIHCVKHTQYLEQISQKPGNEQLDAEYLGR